MRKLAVGRYVYHHSFLFIYVFATVNHYLTLAQRLPDTFAKMLAGREPHKVKPREAGSGLHRLWDVSVVFEGEGHMYLGPGWEHFARARSYSSGTSLSSATTATPCSP